MKTIRKKIKTNVIFSNECFVKCQVFFCLPNSYSIERIQRIHARIDIELKVFFTENSKKKKLQRIDVKSESEATVSRSDNSRNVE